MEFAGDYTSMTKTGYTKRPLIKGMTSEDKRRIYYSLVIPNMFFSLHPDYLMIHTVWPISVDRSLIECDFYFEPEAIADPSFDPSDAMEAWDEINKQDWNVCELSSKVRHLGFMFQDLMLTMNREYTVLISIWHSFTKVFLIV